MHAWLHFYDHIIYAIIESDYEQNGYPKVTETELVYCKILCHCEGECTCVHVYVCVCVCVCVHIKK